MRDGGDWCGSARTVPGTVTDPFGFGMAGVATTRSGKGVRT